MADKKLDPAATSTTRASRPLGVSSYDPTESGWHPARPVSEVTGNTGDLSYDEFPKGLLDEGQHLVTQDVTSKPKGGAAGIASESTPAQAKR
jgi:hypothetical protein